jgi:predicted Ser/Thr protein kinase
MSTDAIVKIRTAIRFGFVSDAEKLLARKNISYAIERAHLAVLKFQQPSSITLGATNKQTHVRHLLLDGILLNRKRDPLAALAKLASASQIADSIPDISFKLDTLLETARVYIWLGNTQAASDCLLEVLSLAEGAHQNFRALAFIRLADLYAELERWNAAKRYIDLAKTLAKTMQNSIFWVQLLDCSVRTNLALGRDAKIDLATLKARASSLPDYLQFKIKCLSIEANLAETNFNVAQSDLFEVKTSTLCQNPHSYEAVTSEVLSARLDIAENRTHAALQKLLIARDWFAEDDLAVPLINTQILLAQCHMAEGNPDFAARELDAARRYCEARGLSLQHEKVEAAFAKFDLSSRPLLENDRSISDSGWKNRQAYVVLERLGSGGQANVFRAHDNIRNKIVAIKKLKIRGPEAMAALNREVRGANAAYIDGIASVIACGQDELGEAYLVQEFIAGQSLRKMLEAGERPLAHILRLAEILKALHLKGVSHGDVKPENVLVTPEGKVVLVDFGLAQIDRTSVQSGATRRYAPPSGPARWHNAAWRDCYALGLMMVEACMGALPEYAASWRDIISIPRDLRKAVSDLRVAEGFDVAEIKQMVLGLLKPI